ncbi:MAG: Type secretion system rane fusion protein PrsE [Pseudomonadota bacterium]|jgi:protease secretion system membrane fusion protein
MAKPNLNQSMKSSVQDAQVVTSEGNDAPRASSDTRAVARTGLLVLAVGFGGFLLWAGLAPLDEGVPTQGMVTLDTKRKTVQHLSGGIVKEVLVQEGQQVKEGQALLRLDGAVAKANYEAVRQRYLGYRAMQSRLFAEQAGRDTIDFHPDVQSALQDPLIKQQVSTQQQLIQARRAALAADLQGIEESIQGLKEQLTSYQNILVQRRSQLALLTEELGNTRGMVKEGYAPRNRQLELERMVAESNAAIADLTGNSLRVTRQVAELTQRSMVRKQEYRKEIESQLADVTREVQSDAEKFVAVSADLDRMEIKSPANGQVVGLAVQTVGAVLQPGQKLLDVVPVNQTLLLEAHIPPHLIDKVQTGLSADIRFNSFAHSPQLVVEGKVMSVSGDLLSDPQQPQFVYYLARIQVTPEGMKTLGARQMQPGMPAEIVIKTGERSLLTYLMHPLVKRMAASMKEE